MKRTKWPVKESMYAQYVDLLRKLAWDVHRKTGVEFDELFGDACLAFVQCMRTRGRERNGKLSTRIQACVHNYLYDVTVKKRDREPPLYISTDDILEKDTPTVQGTPFVEKRLGLSAEGRLVVDILCGSNGNSKPTKQWLKHEMRLHGLSHYQIQEGLREVEELV